MDLFIYLFLKVFVTAELKILTAKLKSWSRPEACAVKHKISTSQTMFFQGYFKQTKKY